MPNRKYQLLLISLLILIIFYPSIFAELNSIDDVEMVTNLLNIDDWSLKSVFLPAVGGGLYYRPVLYGTFIFDRFAWEAGASFMHLENILLHLCNGLLVYLVAEQLLHAEGRKASTLPLIAALCFSLHPIVTEPVNWVSGRTDLIAGTFVLASALFLLKYKDQHRKRFLLLAASAFLLGMLSKEVAFLFIPGGLLILLAKGKNDEGDSFYAFLKQHKRKLILFLVIALCSLAVFFILRGGAFTSNSSRIGMTLKFMGNDPVHAVFVFLRAFGFYVKKFFWPFPLNFAIVEVDPLYELLAIALLLPILYIAWKRTLSSALFICGLFLIVPSFAIAFNQVAWTPYAERYIYIATAFLVTPTVIFLGNNLQGRSSILLKTGVVAILAGMGIATFHRNLTWRTNISLFSDTAQKSPSFTKAWNQLGVAYYEKKDYPNAEINFAKASSLFELYIDEKSDLNLTVVLEKQGKIKEAEEVYAHLMKIGGGKSEKVVDHYVGFLNDKIAVEKDPVKIARFRQEILKYYQNLYKVNKSAQTLYKIGNLKNQMGDRQGARSAYLTAYEMFEAGDASRDRIKRQLAQWKSDE
jgi:protein O-mannosyl-transferase